MGSLHFDKHEIAQRFVRLNDNKQVEFLRLLKSQSIEFASLPIIPHQRGATTTPSYAQTRQWFLWKLDPTSTAYHIAGALKLTGELDVGALHHGFQALVNRHESLRSLFREGKEGSVQQEVLTSTEVDLRVIDLSGLDEIEREPAAKISATQLSDQVFDLRSGPLLRVGLIQLNNIEHILIVVMHHIISDGWSMEVVVNEFVNHYRARVLGETLSLPPLPIQYADYALWQRNWMDAGEQDKQLAYWKAQLGDEQLILQLPADHPRRADGQYRSASISMEMPLELVDRLQRRANAQSATLFVVLLAGFQILLHRYSGQNDIRVGVPIANRHRAETEGLVGFFVNTQVLRNLLDGQMPLNQVLSQAREAALGAQAHQDLPFEQLVEALQPERSLGQNPLFQVMVNHQHGGIQTLTQLPGLSISDYPLGEQAAQFDLTLDSAETEDGRVSFSLNYAKELFEPQTIERMATHYLKVLSHLADAPQCSVAEIELLSEQEQIELQMWGSNPERFDTLEPVHRLIEQQVEQRPDDTALVFADEVLSYTELNRRANQLAHRLIELGVKPEIKVGIAVERSIEMVVGLLAILKAGGVYVPLDPEYPAERLAYMVEDSGIGLLLTQNDIVGRIPQVAELTMLEFDTLDLSVESELNPKVLLHGDNLAYVIYTSGSTGKPKGVGIAHHALVEHSQVSIGFSGLKKTDRMLQFATLNFDAFIEQIFPPLVAGAAVVLRGSGLWDSDTFYRELIDKRISVVDLTTAYWLLLAQDFAPHGSRDYGALRQVHVGGETWPSEGLKAWRDAGLSHIKLLNAYGPTETVVTATIFDCAVYVNNEQAMPAQIPIGRPLAGRRLYVVDTDFHLTPQGVVGELCIGGDLLARSYLNRASLSAERFVADPFDEKGRRLYRTGDLARWNSEGQLEYLGRIDDQVKIRGFRIELGEIEAQLLAQEDVREAVVVAQESTGGQRLVAYISGHADAELNATEMKAALGAVLPDYMVPSAVVVLEALPLNVNGKVDRKALPDAEFNTDHYEAPQGEMEEALAAIWAEVLEVERVGRNDNFFELGGHSLLALKIIALVSQNHGLSIPVKNLFERVTIASLVAYIECTESLVWNQSASNLASMDALFSELEE